MAAQCSGNELQTGPSPLAGSGTYVDLRPTAPSDGGELPFTHDGTSAAVHGAVIAQAWQVYGIEFVGPVPVEPVV
ncbi:hypothetical protein BH23DEI1_BH23DEI1_11490 [soil metagenome]